MLMCRKLRKYVRRLVWVTVNWSQTQNWDNWVLVSNTKRKYTEGGNGNGLPRRKRETLPKHAGMDAGKPVLSWS